jgi:carbon-monoxide dehydrogenase medium subunit
MRLAAPAVLVDVNRLPLLDGVSVTDDRVRVGALVRHADLLAHERARAAQPLLAMALSHVAHATIRNRGTTVGSIVHADAAAEMPTVLAVLGGSVEVASVRGRRTIAAGDLFAGPLESTLAADELALAASFPVLRPGEGVGFAEIARRHGDYALCGVAGAVRLEDGRAVEARLGYLSVNDVPTVVDVTGLDAEAAAERALERLEPADDVHATAAYRAQLVRVLTERVLAAATDHARGRADG